MSSDSKAKYVILVPDGMADLPIFELGERTPLEAARTPWMDRMASVGTVGLTCTIPDDMDPGSDVANLSIMGYAPGEVYTGRAPLEAASMGVELEERDVAFRLNLVTLTNNYTVMADHSADHITNVEARELMAALRPFAEAMGMCLAPGVSYRNLLVWKNGPTGCTTHAPHDFPGEPVDRRMPTGPGSSQLLRMIIRSWKLFENHPVNESRIRRGQSPANSVWPWGQGRRPRMKTLNERFGITGSVVAAVDLIKGIGMYAGLHAIEVPGATGYLDTNYLGKVEAALKVLETQDFVFLHVEAPDEASHSGQLDLKQKAIEDFDEKVAGPMLAGLAAHARWRILLMPDHATPVQLRTHTSDPIPFILLDSAKWNNSDSSASRGFSEETAKRTGTMVEKAPRLMEMLLEKTSVGNPECDIQK